MGTDVTPQSEYRSATGIEYEYKWSLQAHSNSWRPEQPEDGDDVLLGVLDVLGDDRQVRVDPFTFAQSSIYFDTTDWALAGSDLSLAMLINYGAMKRYRWMVLKETVRWVDGRREALELGAEIPLVGVELDTSPPMQRLNRRLGVSSTDLVPYATATQRRRKALWPAGEETLSFALDSAILTPADRRDAQPSHSWWLEVEANEGDEHALDLLDQARNAIAQVIRQQEVRTSKPQEAALLCGWTGPK